MYLIGSSIDIHKIHKNKNKPLILGTVKIESEWSIIANSDGDIVLHALAESIYGALGLGDLGDHFSDSINSNINSTLILNDAMSKMRDRKYQISNIDLTIISEHIILKEIKINIKKRIIELVKTKKVNIKATRWEDDINKIQVNCSLLLKKG